MRIEDLLILITYHKVDGRKLGVSNGVFLLDERVKRCLLSRN